MFWLKTFFCKRKSFSFSRLDGIKILIKGQYFAFVKKNFEIAFVVRLGVDAIKYIMFVEINFVRLEQGFPTQVPQHTRMPWAGTRGAAKYVCYKARVLRAKKRLGSTVLEHTLNYAMRTMLVIFRFFHRIGSCVWLKRVLIGFIKGHIVSFERVATSSVRIKYYLLISNF